MPHVFCFISYTSMHIISGAMFTAMAALIWFEYNHFGCFLELATVESLRKQTKRFKYCDQLEKAAAFEYNIIHIIEKRYP